ncbi:MAG: sigma 54-interacting transcriptional regulator, partial [Magnetococcales bacterium]|nr:sigma 54-interacting transcriptional regulator [Magnetococcales bacterium]
QVKLLRVLEQGEVQRVGSEQYLRVDVRVIAATNKNLERMVREERFREDLLYRLNVCPVFIPPLRERRDEIEILFEFFLEGAVGGRRERMPRLEPRLRRFLFREYAYPGNIRELKNIANYVAMIWDGAAPVSLDDLPEKYRRKEGGGRRVESIEGEAAEAAEAVVASDLFTVREGAEKELLVRILQKCRGNVSRVCQEAGLSRSRVYQLLRKFALDPASYRDRPAGAAG